MRLKLRRTGPGKEENFAGLRFANAMRSRCLTAVCVILLPLAIAGQSGAYAKFGPGGETVGLFDLRKGDGRCGRWEVVEQKIVAARSAKRGDDVVYDFSLKTKRELRRFSFVLNEDNVPRRAVEDLLARGRSVKVRACESAGAWTPEEVTRVR